MQYLICGTKDPEMKDDVTTSTNTGEYLTMHKASLHGVYATTSLEFL